MTHYADNLKKSIVTTQGRITQMIHDDNEQTNAAYREAIIRMAREAMRERFSEGGYWFSMEVRDLERFAALVAAAEREACARVCDKVECGAGMMIEERHTARQCAAAIRKRGET